MTGLHRLLPTALGALAALAVLPAGASYTETWDTDPPGAANWFYYDATASGGDAPLTWVPEGHVEVDLGSTTEWFVTGPGYRFPAYTWGWSHPIDLIVDPWVGLALKDGGGLDMAGGQMFLWIGEFSDPTGTSPAYSFFYFDRPFAVGGSDWTASSLSVADPGSWASLAENQGKTVSDLLVGPQQWGFGLFGYSGTPSGTLALDNLRISASAPAPAPLVLIVAGLAGLGLARRGRSAAHAAGRGSPCSVDARGGRAALVGAISPRR